MKNATVSCGAKAVEYVNFGLFTLMAHIEEQMCSNDPVYCETPPLPIHDEVGYESSSEKDGTSPEDEEASSDGTSEKPSKEHSKATSNRLVGSTFFVIFLNFVYLLNMYFH